MTCLSADDHGHTVKDILLHYLGCVEIRDRKNFFDDSYPLWNGIIEEEIKRGSDREQVVKMLATKKEEWKRDCDSEFRRITFLRKTLKTDKHDKHLVNRLVESSAAWRDSDEYKTNILLIKGWRRDHNEADLDEPDTPEVNEEMEKVENYLPEKDVTVPLIQFENGKGVSEKDPRVWNTFPNQKTTINKLMNEEDLKNNLLHRDRHTTTGRIQYFHIHSNNRHVSQVQSDNEYTP